MIWLLLGVVVLALLWALGRWGSDASPREIRQFGLLALAGLCLAVGLWLLVTGRLAGAIALGSSALALYGRYRWVKGVLDRIRGAGRRPGGGGAARASGTIAVAEAYEVLGLKPDANKEAVLAAHRRLMRLAHPDHGGTDYLATRINQARDVLLAHLGG
ncbi:molecular chaperone DnaJ [Parapedomonas caeni]